MIDEGSARIASARRIRRLLRRSDGNTALDFALLALPFLLVVFGVFEFGRLLWVQNALHYSVEEAARCGVVNLSVCSNASQTQTFASTRSGATFPTSTFTVTTPSCGNKVSASYPFIFVTPLINYSVTLTAESCFPT
ncbi:MAG: TadE family protein [Terriglobales bacterium]